MISPCLLGYLGNVLGVHRKLCMLTSQAKVRPHAVACQCDRNSQGQPKDNYLSIMVAWPDVWPSRHDQMVQIRLGHSSPAWTSKIRHRAVSCLLFSCCFSLPHLASSLIGVVISVVLSTTSKFSGICADIVAEVCSDAMDPGASLFLHLALKLLPVPGALDRDACMRCIARARTRWKGMALDVEYGMAWSKEDKGHHFFIQGTNRYS
ncbi:hypothetical protein EV361DRAFT_252891 [Lentinula raphanica]|nr:hypothetical protein EV361DRAFT_252891 [Lentinula raphanica]